MNFYQKTGYRLLYYSCALAGLLPAWFLYYVVGEIIYLVIYYIVRYRVKVTRSNLANSFPGKNKKELRSLERKFYRHLAEVFVDTIDLTSISRRQILKRLRIIGEEEHRAATEDKDWIAALGHYGSWEYFMCYSLGSVGRESLAIYRPIHNRSVDEFFLQLRRRMGLTTVPMGSIIRRILANRRKGTLMSIGIVADQTPPKFELDHWYDFLNQPTAFFNGTEKIALKFNMPVYFVHVEKRKRGHYDIRFEQIYDGKEEIGQFELTERYVRRLEAMILRRPELWIWSHRRWKHTWRYHAQLEQERQLELEREPERQKQKQEQKQQNKKTRA